jgi:hypothetical protein
MPEALTDKIRATLASYYADVKALPNESAKTHRFSALIAELFPGTHAATDFAAGVEKVVRVERKGKPSHGFIDSYYGNAVIEFEVSLKTTGDEAERQLREYIAGLWNKEAKPVRPLVGIASDGINWRVFRPAIIGAPKGKLTEKSIELALLRELKLFPETFAEFWIWLTSLLFRPERLAPSLAGLPVDPCVARSNHDVPRFRNPSRVVQARRRTGPNWGFRRYTRRRAHSCTQETSRGQIHPHPDRGTACPRQKV